MEDGWFKTGDCVVRTEAGEYKILGRLSQDIIKKGGYKLSALEIEDRLLQHPSVAEVAVIGVPDEKYGEEICAYVVGNPGIQRGYAEHTLLVYCKQHMAGYKVPRQWRFVDSLPRNQMGKVSKKQLLEGFERNAKV